MATTDVGYVIPTLGRSVPWLNAAVDSVKRQSYRPEIMVVGPESSTLERFTADKGLTYLVERSVGLSAAVNQGVEAFGAEVKFVSWLGDDDVLAPAAVESGRNALLARDDATFVFGQLRFLNDRGQPKWLLRPGRWAVNYSRWGTNFISQQGSLIRRSSWVELGGLDLRLQNSMDQDMFLRLADIGKVVYLPREMGAFRIHPTSISSLKGASDETRLVGRRYRRLDRPRIVRAWSRVLPAFDRAILSIHSRVPSRSRPLVDGEFYLDRAARLVATYTAERPLS